MIQINLLKVNRSYTAKARYSKRADALLASRKNKRKVFELMAENKEVGYIDGFRVTKGTARYGKKKPAENKWKFKNWFFPGTIPWGAACWLIGGSVTGSTWWTANDDNTKQVESFCIFGFCFEKEIGDLK